MSQSRFLALLSGASLALVAFKIGDQNFWLDEDLSMRVAQLSWSGMRDYFLYSPVQHPLYYLVLRGWTVFGASEGAARSLSMVFTVASLWPLYALTRQLVNERVAKLAAALFCFSPFSLYFGQEARMYSMLGFLTLASALLFLRCLRAPSRLAVVSYALVAVLGAYTHLYFLFSLAAQFIYLLVRHRSQYPLFRRMVAAQGLAVAAYLPWALLIVSHNTEEQTWKGAAHVIFGIPYTLLRFSLGYSQFLANYQWEERMRELLISNWLVLSVSAICCGVLAVSGIRYVFRQRANGLFVALSLAVPMVIAVAVSSIAMLIGDRYLIVSFPFYVIVLASGVAELWERRGRLGLAGKALIVAYATVVGGSLYNHYFNPEFGKEQWTEVAALIGASSAPSDLIVLRSGYVAYPFLRYYNVPASQQVRKSEELNADSLLATRRVWLVLAHAPDAKAYAARVAMTHPIRREWLFPRQSGIRVMLMDRGDAAATR